MKRQSEEMKFVEPPVPYQSDMRIARLETIGHHTRTDDHLRTINYLRMKCETGERYKISEHYDIRLAYRYHPSATREGMYATSPEFPNGNVWIYSLEINCGEQEHPIWEVCYHAIQGMQKGIFYAGGVLRTYLEAQCLDEIADCIRCHHIDVDQIGAQSVGSLNLSVRVRKMLVRLNVQTIGELIACNAAKFSGLPRFEEKYLKELREKLAGIGLKLAGDP